MDMESVQEDGRLPRPSCQLLLLQPGRHTRKCTGTLTKREKGLSQWGLCTKNIFFGWRLVQLGLSVFKPQYSLLLCTQTIQVFRFFWLAFSGHQKVERRNLVLRAPKLQKRGQAKWSRSRTSPQGSLSIARKSHKFSRSPS